ncbi:hypothetical protein HNO92_000162 [Chromobacterium alkanivorans]|nr:hypothetical protein [Chromobacterium alkanivorans]MCS3816838.1 hypothetical protein [Chromobacterium alkanivorans]MCS3871878.1 hypothetical protein [Chromobacterium alkanivorans]
MVGIRRRLRKRSAIYACLSNLHQETQTAFAARADSI